MDMMLAIGILVAAVVLTGGSSWLFGWRKGRKAKNKQSDA